MNLQAQVADPLRAWLVAAGAAIVALVIGSLAFPARVFDGFIWRYFWGPVVADAHGVGTDAGCAVREGGEVTILESPQACETAAGIAAQPGYTTISTISYAIVLLFVIVGVVLLMRRMQIGSDRELFFALIPYVFLGGTVRVIEDANALWFRESGELIIGMPWAGVIISPLIYFAVFAVAAVALLGCLWLADREVITRYSATFAGIGILALAISLVILTYFGMRTDVMEFNAAVPIITLGGATLIAGAVWVLTERFWPVVNAGTGWMGVVVVWGHTVDGIANVLSLDWAAEIGIGRSYTPKNVVNRLIRDTTTAVQPGWLSDLIGTAWPFLPVKVLVAVLVVWVFNDEMFEESPSFTMLLLIAVLAVGMGPGTRDFLRATLGI